MTSVVSSCNGFLDELPDNRMELDSKDDVAKLLISAYSTAFPAYLLETFSDNTDEYVKPGWTAYDRYQEEAWNWSDITQVGNETPQHLWNSYYSAIASANQALEYMDGLDAAAQKEYSSQLGEALLCRSYAMFKMSEVFCQAYDPEHAATDLGLPYPLKPEKTIGEKYERGTLAELYEKIDADLQRGLSLCGNEYSSPKFHFTQNAAYAFACRFYLNYRKYDKAVEYATKVLGSNPTSKLRDWATFKGLSANEQIQPNDYVDAQKSCNILLLPVGSIWGILSGPYSLGQKYRHGQFISEKETLESNGVWGTSDKSLGINVFINNSLAGHFLRNIPYAFEFTDVQAQTGYAHSVFVEFSTDRLLMERAEAYALMGNYDAAMEDLNAELAAFWVSGNKYLTLDDVVKFYKSVKYHTPEKPTVKKAFNTSMVTDMEVQEPLLQCIMHLTRILTMHEGERLQYVKRYGIKIQRRSLDGAQNILQIKDEMDARDPRLAIQLPADVITSGMAANPR